MSKKIWKILLLCVEISVLVLLTPAVYWNVYWSVGDTIMGLVERHVHNMTIAWMMVAVILAISILCVIGILISQLVKIMCVKVFAIWIILMIDAIAVTCLLLPFARWA
jgi:hypothetical protein